MLEYGIKVIDEAKDNKPELELYVYFTPMTYFDWIYCSSTEKAFDPAYMRGLFTRYIIRLVRTKPQTEENKYTIYDLMEENDNIKMKIINSMIDKAGYDSEETLLSTVRICRDKSTTLAGIYDSFVMVNTDFNFYVQFLNSDIFTRSQIISSLEKTKHFTVEDRYMDSIKEKIEINLIHAPDEYDKWKFERNKKQAMANQGKQHAPQVEKREVVGEDFNSIVEQSKIALDQAMKITRQTPSKAFDWEKDEQEFGE